MLSSLAAFCEKISTFSFAIFFTNGEKNLSLSEKLDNQYLQQVSSKNLVMNYLVLNDKANYVYYNNLYLSKLTQIENTEQEAVNTAFNLISQEKEELSAQRNKSNINKLVVTIGISIVLLIVVFFYFNKTIAEKKRVTELLNYLEVTRNNMVNRYTEKKEAQNVIDALKNAHVYDSPVVTTIEPLTQFYKAEDYHQGYYENNKNQPYCKMVIQPKIEKFEKLFKNRLKKE